jgi:membrane associated rhomboid family serine protease
MIPIRTDRYQERTPWVNYALLLANLLIFVFLQRGGGAKATELFWLDPDRPELFQFVTSTFLHGGWGHLLGNMVFLWVFGNAVNDSFGHVGYLAFYLAGGIFANIGYVLLAGGAPVLGASGAISAVTGAFLVLFPRVRVTLLIPFYILVPLEVSSLVFLALQFVWNLFASFSSMGGGVAYWAHTSGYVFGIACAAALLATRILPRDVYDLLSLFRTWRRRQSWRSQVASGYDPFRGHGLNRQPPRRPARWVSSRPSRPRPPAPPDSRELELRRSITAAHARGDLAAAARDYLTLVQLAEQPVLPLNQQLDVANYLMSSEQYPAAADAYERFLSHYSGYDYLGDIKLMLGLIYSRYLHQNERAEVYLSGALDGLYDRAKRQMAEQELAKVRSRKGR